MEKLSLGRPGPGAEANIWKALQVHPSQGCPPRADMPGQGGCWCGDLVCDRSGLLRQIQGVGGAGAGSLACRGSAGPVGAQGPRLKHTKSPCQAWLCASTFLLSSK